MDYSRTPFDKSRVNGFVRRVAERAAAEAPAGIDGVAAVTHTEGGGTGRPNNIDHVLRVLAGCGWDGLRGTIDYREHAQERCCSETPWTSARMRCTSLR